MRLDKIKNIIQKLVWFINKAFQKTHELYVYTDNLH